MELRRERLLKAFGVINIIFILAVVYLLFFNLGLELSGPAPTEEGMVVFVRNSSAHSIQNIRLYYFDAQGSKVPVKTILELQPGKSLPVTLSNEWAVENEIRLQAEAPFHLPAVRNISLFGAGLVRIKPILSYPGTIVIGTPADVIVQLCNEGAGLEEVVLYLDAEPEFFQVEDSQRKFPLRRQQCVSQVFTLHGTGTGFGKIYFNIKALSFRENYPATIQVVR